MAVSLNLITFSGGTVAPKTDGIIYDSAIGQCGVFYGCNVTANGNTVFVSNGYGMIRGRFFEMNDSSVQVTLSPSGTLSGRIYLRLDLSNTTAPLQLLVATGSTLPDLTQEEDANFTNGVWETELATFDIGTSDINNVVETFESIVDNNTLIKALQNRIGEYRFSISSNISTAQWPIGYGYYDASTKTARIYFSSRYSANIASGTTHFTIPEPYRPIIGSPINILVYNDTNSVIIGSQTVETNGKITQGLTGYCRAIIGFGEYKVQ